MNRFSLLEGARTTVCVVAVMLYHATLPPLAFYRTLHTSIHTKAHDADVRTDCLGDRSRCFCLADKLIWEVQTCSV